MGNCRSAQAVYEDHNFTDGICAKCGEVDKPAVKEIARRLREAESLHLDEKARANSAIALMSRFETRAIESESKVARLTGVIGEAVHFLSSGHGITVEEGQRQLKAMLEGGEAEIYRHALRKSEESESIIKKIADLAASAAAFPITSGRFVSPSEILTIIEEGKK